MPMGLMNWPPLIPYSRTRCEEVGQQLLGLGFAAALEMKPSSLAVHWRGLEPEAKERLRSLTYSVFEHLAPASGLRLLPFDGGLEVRSTDRTKGTAVRQILAQEPAAIPLAYLGDDLTDEDAFAEVGNRGPLSWCALWFASRPPAFGYARRKSCSIFWTPGSKRHRDH